jgi:hypothetical protein
MTKLEVLDQPLYGNSNIVFNGKPIFPQILHGVEYIKFAIYTIVKKIILKIQILYLIHWSIKETGIHNEKFNYIKFGVIQI